MKKIFIPLLCLSTIDATAHTEFERKANDVNFAIKNLCTEMQLYANENNLSIIANSSNTEWISSSHEFNLNTIDCNKTGYADLVYLNRAFAVLIPDNTSPAKSSTNQSTTTNDTNDEIIFLAKNYCHTYRLREISSRTIQQGYNETKTQYAECEKIDDKNLRCVESTLFSNKQNQTRMYGKCCLIQNNGKQSDGAYSMSMPRPSQLHMFNNSTQTMTLDDFDTNCQSLR